MGSLAGIPQVPNLEGTFELRYLGEKARDLRHRRRLLNPPRPRRRPNQAREDHLMPFPVLDSCFHLFAGEKLLPEEVLEALRVQFPELGLLALQGHVEKFVRLFLASIYKWVQAPLSLHIGNLDLDRERA